MTEIDPEAARRAIVEHTRRLADAAAAAGPGAAVPTAPGWTVADLVAHLGQTQHWVAEIIERRITDPMQLPGEMATQPDDPDDWPSWLAASAQRFVQACDDDALAAPVFNAAADERTGAQFWLSSVLNESVVHGADAALAAGWPVDVEPEVAAALVTNHLRMLTSPTWAMQRPESADALRGTGQTLQLLADDGGGWFVERLPDGARWEAGTRAADVTVSGSAGSLLLVLTRRLPLSEVGIEGDAELARHWVERTAHAAD